MFTLLERAYKLCSDHELLHREIEDLKRALMRNGYNEDFIYKIVKQFLDKKYDTSTCQGPKFGPKQYSVYISLPYLGEASEKIKGNINSCLSKLKCGSLNLVFIDKFSRIADWFNFKDKQPKHLIIGAVYKVKCSCKFYYIGESGRCLKTRFNEHDKATGKHLTEVGKHLKQNPGHTLDFDHQVEVLGRCQPFYKRKILESLHLQDHKRDPYLLNEMGQSRPLFLFNV